MWLLSDHNVRNNNNNSANSTNTTIKAIAQGDNLPTEATATDHPKTQNTHKGGNEAKIGLNLKVPSILGDTSGQKVRKQNTSECIVSLPMSSAGSTVIRLLGYGFYEDGVFEKPYANKLRNISSKGCCVLNHEHYDKVVFMENRSMRSFLVDGIKYIRIYDPDTNRFFTQPVARAGSDFLTSELEDFRKLHREPDITGRFPRKLSKTHETDGKVETGKVYDLHNKYGDIDTQLIMKYPWYLFWTNP